MRGIAASEGGFLSGMNTYIMKVGPDNLNDGYASKIDRMIAAFMPTLSMRPGFRILSISLLMGSLLCLTRVLKCRFIC
jgi:hypothetical protein